MFFILPFALGSIVGIIVLISSLLFKRYRKLTLANIMTYIGMLVGLWFLREGYVVVRGFEGAMVCLIGINAILECFGIRVYLYYSNKNLKKK